MDERIRQNFAQCVAVRSAELFRLARNPRPLVEKAWRAGRRLTWIVSSAATAIAAAVLPRSASGAIPLRSPLELRQIVSAIDYRSCPAGTTSIAGPPPGPVCLSSVGMTVTAVRSAYVQMDTFSLPASILKMDKNYRGPTSVMYFTVVLGFEPSVASQIAALTRDIYRQPRPRDELAVIVRGRFLGYEYVTRPFTQGVLRIDAGNRPAAKSLLNQLLHG